MTTDSDEILFKKRARRRLVGAVVFASVVAIVLPMLMDANPNPRIDDVLVRIPPPAPRGSAPAAPKAPSAPTAPTSPTSALDDLVNRTSPPSEWGQSPSIPEMPQETSFPSLPDIDFDQPSAPASKQQSAKTTPAKTAKTPEKPKTPSRSEILAAQRAAAEKEAARNNNLSESERAAAILEGRYAAAPSKPVAVANSGNFLIALGTFSNAANVKNLTNKLNSLGVPNYTENLPNQQIRVRAGPFGSAKAAEDAHAKMGKNGVDGKIIKAQ